MDKAVAAAKKAFYEGPWGTMNARDRGTLIFRYSSLTLPESFSKHINIHSIFIFIIRKVTKSIFRQKIAYVLKTLKKNLQFRICAKILEKSL